MAKIEPKSGLLSSDHEAEGVSVLCLKEHQVQEPTASRLCGRLDEHGIQVFGALHLDSGLVFMNGH